MRSLLILLGMLINFVENRKARPKACCVPGCGDKTSKRHRFPKRFPDMMRIWIERIKPRDYQTLTTEEMYGKYVVCEKHFSASDVVPGRRGLKITALPCLHIPGFEFHQTDIPKNAPLASALSSPSFDASAEQFEPNDAVFAFKQEKTHLELWEDELLPVAAEFSIPLKRLKFDEDVAGQSAYQYYLSSEEQLEDSLPPFQQDNMLECELFESKCNTSAIVHPVTHVAIKKGIRRARHSIFGQVNESRATNLTPKAKTFYTMLTKWSVAMARKQRRITSYQKRLANAERLNQNQKFNNSLKYVHHTALKFISRQIKNQELAPRSRRYTLEDKIMALSLFKNSGKSYRLIHKIFSLPSTRTLNNLLERIPMRPGINEHIFRSLKESVAKMKDDRTKTCILMFDEMKIDTALKYERKSDHIFGFQDNGESKEPLIATHAHVFMLKGIYRQWKQPIVFSFHQGPIKAITLKKMIKSVVIECFSIGLDVVATVCDQGSANQDAINMLLKETEELYTRHNMDNPYFGFTVSNREIIPLFDIPHLFKGIRNNLLTKNLHFVMNGVNKVAKWIHIEQFYKLDTSEPNLRLCHKLTDAHVIPSKIEKKKVGNCTQVFSRTVGCLMKRISKWDIKDKYSLSRDAEATADLILFLDRLFDSFNVSRYSKVDAEKPLKSPVTQQSNHRKFWCDAREVIDSMRFYCPKKNCFVVSPSLKNLQFTIQGFSILVNILLAEKKFKFVFTGAMNQDSLENFFSCIASHRVRNVNLDCAHFIGSFKTLVVNNYMANHPSGSNCQKDIGVKGLDNLRSFLTGETVASVTPFSASEIRDVQIWSEIFTKKSRIGMCTIKHMSGAIVKILLKNSNIQNCNTCCNNLLKRQHSANPQEENNIIEAKHHAKGFLIRPGDLLNFIVSLSLNKLFCIIPRCCTESNLSEILHDLLFEELAFKSINCSTHNLGRRLCKLIVRCSLFWWCNRVNKILKGYNICYFSIEK